MLPRVAYVAKRPFQQSTLSAIDILRKSCEVQLGETPSDFQGNFDCVVASNFRVMESVHGLLEKNPNCKWVHSMTVGVDGLRPLIDAHLVPNRVSLTNARGAFSHSLAEYALTSMLYFNKQIQRIQKNSLERNWERFEMFELRHRKLFLIGYGDIAKATGSMAKAFKMEVSSLRRAEGLAQGDSLCKRVWSSEHDKKSEWLAALREADYVVCSLPGSEKTKHFVNDEVLGALNKDAVLVSLGRGMCVDEAALARTLDAGAIRGAALDVFETEPLAQQSPLWGRSNVLITAHNADLVSSYEADSMDVLVENVEAYKQGKPFLTPVSLQEGY